MRLVLAPSHSASCQPSRRCPLLCRRILTSLPAARRLHRELPVELARLVYLEEPWGASSHSGQGRQLPAMSPESTAASPSASLGGSQPSISSGFLGCVFCFKTKLSQNPGFFSALSSSLSRVFALQEMREVLRTQATQPSMDTGLFAGLRGHCSADKPLRTTRLLLTAPSGGHVSGKTSQTCWAEGSRRPHQ